MNDRFDHYNSYDPNKPAWEQRTVGSFSAQRETIEGPLLKFVTGLGYYYQGVGLLGVTSVAFSAVLLVLLMFKIFTPASLFNTHANPIWFFAAIVFYAVSMGGLSAFLLRMGGGLVEREGWARKFASYTSILALAFTPIGFLGIIGNALNEVHSVLDPGTPFLLFCMLSSVAFNGAVVFLLSRKGVKDHF